MCVPRLPSEKVFSEGSWEIGIESHREILQGHMAPRKYSGKKGSIPRNPSKNVKRSHGETLHQERCARRVAWDLVKSICKLKNADKSTFYSLTEAWVMPALTLKKPEEREFVVDSGASMHMLSKKGLSSGELESLRKSRNPQR